MLRFILKKEHGGYDYPKIEELYTLDIDVPELEACLKKGGHSQYGFEQHVLVGVELLDNQNKETIVSDTDPKAK